MACCFQGFGSVSHALDPSILGDWHNKNASSYGVTRIFIRLAPDNAPIVHVWEGYNQENDWGEQIATIQEPAGKEIYLTCTVRGISKTQKLTLLPEGDLRLSDKSGRPSYYVAGIFAKGLASKATPATPAPSTPNAHTKTGAHPVTVTRDYQLGGPGRYIQLSKGQVYQGKVFIDRLEIEVRGVWYSVPRSVAR